MKIKLLLLSLVFSNFNLFAQQIVDTKVKQNLKKPSATFEENKGQMKDQNWLPRPDVLYYGSQEGMNYYIRSNGVSFQLSRVDSWREEESRLGMSEGKKSKVPDQISTYRVDAQWIAHNPNFVVEKGKALDGYNNYYNVPDGVEPALFVKQFESVLLKNVWNGIDIYYYGTTGHLETDYLISPGSDYRDIQIEIKGAELSISNDGNLIMKTPFGEIQEGELKVFQEGERLNAFWKIGDNNRVSFVIPKFNPFLAMRIDPVTRAWGTYYGGSNLEYGRSTTTDISGNVYLAGYTSSTTGIASGGHQNTCVGGAAFLVKFSSAGVRQWGTYYGNSSDGGSSTTTDVLGNVFLAGVTTSSSGIAFGGHQNIYGGGINVATGGDAFLVKFNSAGVRQWGTYYGGSGDEIGNSICTDAIGNVYLAGSTSSSSGIAFGGHQNSYGGVGIIGLWGDAFLVKFNSAGVRQWGTYYGGSGNDEGFSIDTDTTGNVYLCGTTESSNSISSQGHQNQLIGPNDAFLVQFNSNGVRQWATYYGGNQVDWGYATTTDGSGNVYLAGETASTSFISYLGHQNSLGGGSRDAFLVKFNNYGVRQWGTYYGGMGADYGFSCVTDSLQNIYLCGKTTSVTSMASGGFQNSIGSLQDAYLVKFNNNGVRQWGTYYGGWSNDASWSVAKDATGNIYMSGETETNTIQNIIASNGHQNAYGGGANDAFLVKFSQFTITTQPPTTFSTCSNLPANLSLTVFGSGINYQWQMKTSSGTLYTNVPIGGTNSFSGVNSNTLVIGNPVGLSGYSFQCIVSNSFISEISTVSVLTVNPVPSILSQPNNLIVCSSNTASFNLSASGTGLTYQWQNRNGSSGTWQNCSNGSTYNGSATSALQILNLTGLNNYQYRCIVTNNTACSVNSNVVNLTVNPIPTITTQPVSVSQCVNQTTSFTIVASGTGLTYQWQSRLGSTGTWINCSNGSIYSGSTTNTLQVLNLAGLNNYQYICLVTNSNACSTTSNIATLTVYSNPSPSITADGMSSNPVTINFGDVTNLVLSGALNSSNPNIVWSPSVGLSSNSVTNPIAYPTSSTNYTATFTNTYGCTQSVSQQVNVNMLPNNGTIAVTSSTGINNFNVFDTLKVEVRLVGVSDIYAAYARLRYSGPISPYLTYLGYTAGTILGTGGSVISTPPVAVGSYGYDFGISKIGSVSGYSGTGTLYTFYFKPNNIPSNLIGSQACFYVDNLSISNATVGAAVGLVNQGPNCFNYSNQTVVWPGDLDNNKSVNTADLLKIGIFYNNTGPMRPNANLQWVAQPATLWGYNTSSPNSDAFKVFADGNGDGIINNADQTSVGFNMGKIHALAQPMDSASFNRIATTGDLVVVPTPGYVSASAQSQQLDLSVSLANAGSTLNNLYGISFDIAVDTNVFDLQNTTFDYSGSIFGIPSQNFLKIEYVANGVVSVGMTRFNNPSVNGNGLLCKIRLNTYPALNYSGTNLTFNGTVTAANDSIGMPYAIGPASVQIPYGSSASISETRDDNSQVILYPNPAGELLNVMINEEVFVKEIKVLDETGRVVIIKTPNSMIAKYTIETLNLAEGIYTIQLITKDSQIYKKFVKKSK